MKRAPVVVLFLLSACGESNPPELNEAASKAAQAFCDCAKEAVGKPSDELAKSEPCEAEEKAYETAWKALPVAGRDPKAEAISTLQHECRMILSDAHAAARQAQPAKP